MRNLISFIKDICVKPPLIFPFIGGFHVLWTIWIAVGLIDTHIGWEEMVKIGWMIGYTVFWLAACDLRKWGALGYCTLTIVNIIIYLSVSDAYMKSAWMSILFLIDAIFCFFLLFFFKRFNNGN